MDVILAFIALVMVSTWCLFVGISGVSSKSAQITMAVIGFIATAYLMWLW